MPKQDHLVCFLGGSLMLGATTAGSLVRPVSIPPLPTELTETGKRDWKTGVELVKTCIATHDTATYVRPYRFATLGFTLCSTGDSLQKLCTSEFLVMEWTRLGTLPRIGTSRAPSKHQVCLSVSNSSLTEVT